MYPPADNWAANVATASGNTCGTCRPPIAKVEAIAAGFEKGVDWSLENSGLLCERPAGGWWWWQWLPLPTQLLVGGPKTEVLLSAVGVGRLSLLYDFSLQPNLVPQSGCLVPAFHYLGAF